MHGGNDRPRCWLPMGLLGMIGLVAVVELVLSANFHELLRYPDGFDWRTTGLAAGRDEVRRSEVLCFGDSLIKLGVYPRVLEARLGLPAFNLALQGGPPPTSYFLLRRALDSGARPKAVVVDFHAKLLLLRPDLTADYWPELLTTRELFELSLVVRDLRVFTRTALAMALPSVKDRHPIRSRVLAALQGQPWPGSGAYPIFLRNWRLNRGTLVRPRPKSPDTSDKSLAGPAPAPLSAWWVIDRTATTYVDKFLDLTARRGIPVFWLLPPNSPAYLADCERSGRDARYTAYVRATQARYANVVVIDGRRSGYGRDLFIDATHLNRLGASSFSESVALLIGSYRAGPEPPYSGRWVQLPAYQARPEPVPLEDLEQSTTALRNSADRLRR